MLPRLLSFIGGAGIVYVLFRFVRKLLIEFGQRRQRIFIRRTVAASRHPKNERIIVSFSTLPDRITQLERTLTCLLEQTRPPDEILLVVPCVSLRQGRPYIVPPSLLDVARLRMVRSDRDWGPATKFIPAIQMELAAGRPETQIVIVDDDRIYPRDAIESYLHWSGELPEAALCFRGAAMPRSFEWRKARMVHGNRLRTPRRVAVVTGCGSYLIKPRFFDESLWDYTRAPAAAFYMDDIWISGCLDQCGIEKYVVPSSRRLLSVREQKRTMSLHDVPEGRQPNNNAVIAFFRETWNVFAR